jgi:hypothetical protein
VSTPESNDLPQAAKTPASTPAPTDDYDIGTPLTGTEPASAPASVPAAPVGLSADLLKLAERTGFSKEDLAGLDERQASLLVNKAAFRLLDPVNALASAVESKPASAPAASEPAAAAPARPPERAGAPSPPSEDPDFEPTFNPEEFDPRLAKVLNGLLSERRELRAQVEELRGREHARSVRHVTRQVDAKFAALDKETFGEGSIGDLADAAAKSRRHFVLSEARRLAGPGASDETVIAKIPEAAALHYPASRPSAPPKISKEQWDAGAVETPTQRNGTPMPKGEAAFKKKFIEGMNELNAAGIANGDTDEL